MNTFKNKTKGGGENLFVRLGGVIVTWNNFKHFFPYWEYASKAPDVILKTAIEKALKDQTAIDFKKTLLLMTEPLNDGHVEVGMPADTSESYIAPVLLSFTESKIVVNKVLDKQLNGQLFPGDIIQKIDDSNALLTFEEKKRFISGSPQWKMWNSLIQILAGAKNSRVKLTVLRDSSTFEISVFRTKQNLSAWQLKEERRKSGWIKEGIYYLDLDKIHGDSVIKIIDTLSKAKALICDLRGYPVGGNRRIINYLLKQEEDSKWLFIPQITYPDYEVKSFAEFGWNMKPKTPHLTGKIIYIIDGRAMSHSESCMGFIKDFKLATIVGAPTAGTNGNENYLRLPGGYSIVWTGMLVKNRDGSRMYNTGIVPDVPVERTIQAIRQGRDEFFEKALELAEN
jgi:C-terminal processing protease CtpA/Prc